MTNFILGWDNKTASFIEKSGLKKRIASLLLRAEEDLFLGYGGMIVISSNVNALTGKGLLGKVKAFGQTMLNRWYKDKYTDDEIRALAKKYRIDTGWSVGNLFKGHYYSPDSGDSFDEQSFSIDVRGAPLSFVKEVAKALARKFKQESVLLIDHETNKSFLVKP